jgi:hypothetical protein
MSIADSYCVFLASQLQRGEQLPVSACSQDFVPNQRCVLLPTQALPSSMATLEKQRAMIPSAIALRIMIGVTDMQSESCIQSSNTMGLNE